MICLRCGYCCTHHVVVIVDKPELGTVENNLIIHEGKNKPCRHLCGSKKGEYACALHDFEWYKETPCFQFTQIGREDSDCRIGQREINGRVDLCKVN